MFNAYAEHINDEATHADYMREAYGDACPCGQLRWGGDCPRCYDELEFTDDDLDAMSLHAAVDTWEVR